MPEVAIQGHVARQPRNRFRVIGLRLFTYPGRQGAVSGHWLPAAAGSAAARLRGRLASRPNAGRALPAHRLSCGEPVFATPISPLGLKPNPGLPPMATCQTCTLCPSWLYIEMPAHGAALAEGIVSARPLLPAQANCLSVAS